MYLSHFGLHKWPFKLTPDLAFFYRQASREAVAEAVQYALARGDGVIKVSGDVGIGKTMLMRLLMQRLSGPYQVLLLSAPNMAPVDILKLIARDLSASVPEQATKADLLSGIQQALIARHQQGKKVILMVDEAQALTLDALEEIRLLGNLETEWDKLLQVILFGQPELDKTLDDPRMRPLKDRLACNVVLKPLNASEVKGYLNYRMRIAGFLENDFFDDAAAKKIHRLTQGLPRSMNLLADKLLMAVYADGGDRLKSKHFKKIDEVAPRPAWRWGLLSGAAVLAAGAYLAGAYWTPWTDPAATQTQVADVAPESSVAKENTQTETQVAQASSPSDPEPARAEPSSSSAEDQEASQPALEEVEVAPEQPPVTLDTNPSVTPQAPGDDPVSKKGQSSKKTETPVTPQTSETSTIQENYQAWSQSLSMDASNLLKLLTMHEKLKKYTKQVHSQKLFLLMAPQPVDTFQKAHARLMDRLSWDNRAHVYAYVTFENRQTGEAYYQWVYDPRASQTPVLERKLQQIEALTQTQSGEIVSAKALNAIIAPER